MVRMRPSPPSRPALAAAVVAVLPFLLSACTSESLPIAADAKFAVLYFEPEQGRSGSVADLDALKAALPFDLVLPSDLPSGFQLTNANVNVPSNRFNPDTPRRYTSAHLTFVRAGSPPEFMLLIERPRLINGQVPPQMFKGDERLDILGAPASLSASDNGTRLLAWSACGLDVWLTVPDTLSREDHIGLAESMIESCI